ncbi:MAG TPA: long-chain fatty acid--CoA ligase [Planctomycetota bacterium]
MEPRPWHARYDPGVAPTLAYAPLTLPELLRRSATNHPRAPALRFANLRLSYAELLEEVECCAAALAALGAGPGTRIALQMPNVPQMVIAYYGALALGCQVVLTNPLYTAREIEHQWNDAGCTHAVTMDFLYAQKVRALRPRLAVEHFLLASFPEYLRWPLSWLAPLKLRRRTPPAIAPIPREPGVQAFRAALRAQRGTPPPRPAVALDALAVLQYTGGTTGVSKAAMLTHRNLSVNVQQMDAWFGGTKPGTEVVLVCLPLFHVFAMTCAMNFAVQGASAMVLVPDPRDTKSLMKAIARHRVTVFPGVPALYNSLNHWPGIEGCDLSSVRLCLSGSAPIAPEVLQRFERLTGSKIVEGYGLSETSPLTHANPVRGERRIGWVGLPVCDTDARVVDVEDPTRVLAPGEAGELALHGPQVMQGYWKRPDETALVLKDGWFLTGDLAVMSPDGYFRIVGRKKDMVIVGGLKVFPDEVDAALHEHEGVLEAATIGLPDPERGELVKSFVVAKPGRTLAQAELQTFLRERLAPYKVPREIEFVPELPKSTVMKILRRELRERELKKRAS